MLSRIIFPWKSNKYYIFLFVRVCVLEWVRVCICGCGCLDACACACTYALVHLLIKKAKRMRHILLLLLACLAQPNFRHYLIYSKIFGKSLSCIKCVLISSINFCLKHSRSKKNIMIHCRNCENVFMQSTRYSCRVLKKH